MIVQLSEATQYYYYRAVLAILSLTPDQIRAQIWPNGVRGGKCNESSAQDNENLVKFLISSGHLPPPVQVLPDSTSELAIMPNNVITVLALQFSL